MMGDWRLFHKGCWLADLQYEEKGKIVGERERPALEE